MKLILASGSPRRRELLGMFAEELLVLPAKGEETPHPELTAQELVMALARAKAEEVAAQHPDALVIGADTVVCLDGAVLGKPRDAQDAKRMLGALSGREHEVLTGLALAHAGACDSAFERTKVIFRSLDEREIEAYVATGEPMDKAGAYGIQGYASLFVERIEGDYFNVMGLPLCRLGTMLKELGVNLL